MQTLQGCLKITKVTPFFCKTCTYEVFDNLNRGWLVRWGDIMAKDNWKTWLVFVIEKFIVLPQTRPIFAKCQYLDACNLSMDEIWIRCGSLESFPNRSSRSAAFDCASLFFNSTIMDEAIGFSIFVSEEIRLLWITHPFHLLFLLFSGYQFARLSIYERDDSEKSAELEHAKRFTVCVEQIIWHPLWMQGTLNLKFWGSDYCVSSVRE